MYYENGAARDLKIAYVGGGSRGWAWGLMSDLASNEDMSGEVYLYYIDLEAAQANEIIGNKFNGCADTKSKWSYKAVKTAKEAGMHSWGIFDKSSADYVDEMKEIAERYIYTFSEI